MRGLIIVNQTIGHNEYKIKRFQEELHATVIPYHIGPIIGICCGPGILHIVCKGKEMTLTAPEEK